MTWFGGTSKRFAFSLLVIGAGLLWAAGVAAGLITLWTYAFGSDRVCRAPRQWPAETSMALDSSRPTLVMFLHPRCPCSRASVEELARLMRFADGRLVAHVRVFVPGAFQEEWAHTDLWHSASAIPNVDVRRDPDAAESRRFGATISGTVVLYGPRGVLLFAGGITNARGHGGDSVGRATILALLDGRPIIGRETRVFGCPIFDFEDPGTCRPVERGPGL